MQILRRLFGRDDGGETKEFLDLVEGSVAGLQLQTSVHADAWRFGEEESWRMDQTRGELVLNFADLVVRAPAQVIGTVDTHAGTWMWAWANSTVAEALKQDALRVRAYGEQHRIRRLTTPSWPAEDAEGWKMTALAARLAEANGAYRGPVDGTHIFMTFGDVALETK